MKFIHPDLAAGITTGLFAIAALVGNQQLKTAEKEFTNSLPVTQSPPNCAPVQSGHTYRVKQDGQWYQYTCPGPKKYMFK